MSRRISVLFALMAAALVGVALPARAEDYSNIRIVRLSFVEGDVQYRRGGEEWATAGINLPIQKGFSLKSGDGYAEVEFENGLTVRMANSTLLSFTELALVDGHRVTRLTIGSGTAIITANLGKLDELSVSISKPGATVSSELNVPHSGRFRVDDSPTENWVTVFHGKVDFTSSTGVISLTGHQTVHEGGAGSSEAQIVRSPAPDAFDKWVSQREDAMGPAQRDTADYLQNRSYSTGFADLYNYGTWVDLPGYGFGWQPWGMGAGWMPFMDGMWSFMPMTGWNWMSNEPWGWMPYHFGGWLDVMGMGWVWVPGGGNLMWQPANATWLQVYGQTGWIPNAPPALTGKSLKRAPVTAPPVAIIAGQGGGGIIRPGGRVHVGTLVGIQHGVAPAQTFTAIGRLPMPRTYRANGPAGNGPAKGIVLSQGNAGMHVPSLNGPAGVRAPVTGNAGVRQGAPTNSPTPVQAPRAMPSPPVMHGGGPTGFGGGGTSGGFNGQRGSGGLTGANGGTSSAGAGSHGPVGPSAGSAGGAGGATGGTAGGGGAKGGGH